MPSVEIVRNFLAFDYNGNLVVLYALLREAPVIHRIAKMMQLPDSEVCMPHLFCGGTRAFHLSETVPMRQAH